MAEFKKTYRFSTPTDLDGFKDALRLMNGQIGFRNFEYKAVAGMGVEVTIEFNAAESKAVMEAFLPRLTGLECLGRHALGMQPKQIIAKENTAYQDPPCVKILEDLGVEYNAIPVQQAKQTGRA